MDKSAEQDGAPDKLGNARGSCSLRREEIGFLRGVGVFAHADIQLYAGAEINSVEKGRRSFEFRNQAAMR